jgi:ferritin-like metal-binding protein YciE
MFEHFEIAAYKSLHTMAEYIDHQPGALAAHTNLQEEIAMAEWIDHRISHTTVAFLDRATAGVTASH